MMRLAINQARKAEGKTWPNPMVGAVVTKGNEVVGMGYHHKAGLQHAEVEAIENARGKTRGADLYVTLEPCHLTGRTGPCVDAIQRAGIKRVIVGAVDPNPKESGRGIAALRQIGIRVEEGVLEPECMAMNEVYNVLITKKRPFIQVKMAASLDGRTATRTGDSKWISSESSRKQVHRMRARAQAIMVGAVTVRHDNPRLDVRYTKGKNPMVVVMDSSLSIPENSRIFTLRRGAPVWIYSKKNVDRTKVRRLASLGAEVRHVGAKKNRLKLEEVFDDLFNHQIYRVLVEGGATLFGSLIANRLVDRLEIFQAPCLLGSDGTPLAVFCGPKTPAGAPKLGVLSQKRSGPDLVWSATLQWPESSLPGTGLKG